MKRKDSKGDISELLGEDKEEKCITIMVLGDIATGKSSLMERFAEKHINISVMMSCQPLNAILIRINNEKLKALIVELPMLEEKKLRKDLADCLYLGLAFSEIQKTMTTMTTMLIFDVTNRTSFEKICLWIKDDFNEECTNSAICLVGCKADNEGKREVRKEEGQKLADIYRMKYFETSAKDDVNVAEAFKELIEKMEQGELKRINPVKVAILKAIDAIYGKLSKNPNTEEEVKETNTYEKVELLGKGSFGKVYKAKNSGKEYAMKVIDITKDSIKVFETEVAIMKVTSLLSNANLVQYEKSYVNESDLEYVIIMEYCSEGNLRAVIEKCKKENRSITEEEVKNYMKQILLGVDWIHGGKIIHRDLKPENILLDTERNLKISDFGISKQLSNRTRYAQTAIGTLWYSSPEVLKGEDYDYSADIWSLGCIFHELCCLEPPCAENNMFKFLEIIQKKSYDGSAISKRYSSGIKELICSMLNFDKKLRPTCKEILNNALFKNEVELIEEVKKSSKVHENSREPEEKNIMWTKKFKGDCNDGEGVANYPNEDIYEGKWKDNMKSGQGILEYANGSLYKGRWKHDKKNGRGVMMYAGNGTYIGEFKNDKREGNGVMLYRELDLSRSLSEIFRDMRLSAIFKGEWKGDKRNGKGALKDTDGKIYLGVWVDDKLDGKVLIANPGSESKISQWKDGKEVSNCLCF